MGPRGLKACPMLREGQVFYADYAKPDGLCDEAWKAIYQYVFALAHGAGRETFYYGDWIRKPGVAICEAATMGCGRSSSSWRRRRSGRKSIIPLPVNRLPRGKRKNRPRRGLFFLSSGRRACRNGLHQQAPFFAAERNLFPSRMRLVVRTAHILPHIEHWCRSLGGTGCKIARPFRIERERELSSPNPAGDGPRP